jgi:hypothetical protein
MYDIRIKCANGLFIFLSVALTKRGTILPVVVREITHTQTYNFESNRKCAKSLLGNKL